MHIDPVKTVEKRATGSAVISSLNCLKCGVVEGVCVGGGGRGVAILQRRFTRPLANKENNRGVTVKRREGKKRLCFRIYTPWALTFFLQTWKLSLPPREWSGKHLDKLYLQAKLWNKILMLNLQICTQYNGRGKPLCSENGVIFTPQQDVSPPQSVLNLRRYTTRICDTTKGRVMQTPDAVSDYFPTT